MTTAYLLDTNAASHIIRFPSGPVASRTLGEAKGAIGLSSIVVSELQFGVRKRGSERLAALVEGLLRQFPILAFGEDAARAYADIRHQLEKSGTPIGPMDTLIAGHATSLDATLVTSNAVEFGRVEGLKVEDWTQA
ncbi:MAG: type II toxin-antitoxin system VapC family toxin [Pseudomonadota bacterium]